MTNEKTPAPEKHLLVPEGWKLVPKEPTSFMISKGIGCDWRRGDDTIRNIWRHMLDAIPSPDIIVSDERCPSCEGTGKEGRHSICRDCDETPSPQTRARGTEESE